MLSAPARTPTRRTYATAGSRRGVRAGYTLVEILVVMGLMLLLATLAAGVGYSGLIGSQKVVGAADRASGWILISKQLAARDDAPRGVRFIGTLAANGSYEFRTAQYIEAPESFVPNPDQESDPQRGRIVLAYEWNSAATTADPDLDTRNGAAIFSRRAYFVSNRPDDIVEFYQRVAVGDSLVMPEFDQSYRVTSLAAPADLLNVGAVTPPFGATQAVEIGLQTYPNLTAGGTKAGTTPATGKLTTLQTYKFSFQGQARPLLGEDLLKLTEGQVIDYRAPTTPAALSGQAVSPAGFGYRTWKDPVGAGPNLGPYHPPTTTGIDLLRYTAATAPTAAQIGQPAVDADGKVTFDILFSPSGQVLNNPNSLICLWVRNPENVAHPRLGPTTNDLDRNEEFNAAGDQVLVVVSTRSGLISTQPVNNNAVGTPNVAFDPYQFAKDGQNNGL